MAVLIFNGLVPIPDNSSSVSGVSVCFRSIFSFFSYVYRGYVSPAKWFTRVVWSLNDNIVGNEQNGLFTAKQGISSVWHISLFALLFLSFVSHYPSVTLSLPFVESNSYQSMRTVFSVCVKTLHYSSSSPVSLPLPTPPQLNVTALDWSQLSKKECVKYGGSLVGKSCKYVPDLALMSFILFFGTYSMTVSLKKFKFSRYFPTKVKHFSRYKNYQTNPAVTRLFSICMGLFLIFCKEIFMFLICFISLPLAQLRKLISDFSIFMSIMTFVGLDMLIGLKTPKLIVPTEFKVQDVIKLHFVQITMLSKLNILNYCRVLNWLNLRNLHSYIHKS